MMPLLNLTEWEASQSASVVTIYMQLADFKYKSRATLVYLLCKNKRVVNTTAINASCQQRTERLKQMAFRSYPGHITIM